MGMSAEGGQGGGHSNEINVTPMIDVLLVLLIIFMMIIPMSRKAIDATLPDPNPSVQTANSANDQIVLSVLADGQFKINQDPYTRETLFAGLRSVYDPRPDKIIFVKGDSTVTYGDVVFAMDQARGAGVKVIGITPGPKDGAAAP
jgi:biopolymer transport protein ExbD